MKNISIFCLFLFLCGCVDDMDNSWSHYRANPDAQQFSPLNQIDTSNVHLLKPIWEFHTGDTATRSTIECNPIIIDNMMYITSPTNQLIALHAASGKEVWRFVPGQMGGINRGVTFHKGKIFFSAGHYLYSIQAHTGNLIQTFGGKGKIDLRENLGKDTSKISISLTTPGVIYKQLLILGSATGEGYEASPGHIRAYDVETGAMKWIFHTIPQKGEFGFETWDFKEGENYGGTNNWGGLSLDKNKGVVFVSTGSPTYDFYGGNRKGENLFANSVIALDASTGKRKWHYQAVKHDIWDYDMPCAPTLATIDWKGKQTDILIQPTKMGELILLERNTGKPLLDTIHYHAPISNVPGEKSYDYQILNQGIKLVKQGFDTNSLTTLSDTARNYVIAQSKKYTIKGMYTPPSLIGTITQPGTRGGMGWGGLSFDPKNKVAYTSCNDFPMLFQLNKLRSKNKNDDIHYEGERLYMLNCAACHGTDRMGNNDGFPGLINISTKYKKNELKSIIVNGKGLMPPHRQFTDSALSEIISYLHAETNPAHLNTEKTNEKYVLNGFRIFTDQEGFPASTPPWGTLNAIDILNQKIKWSVPLGYYPKLKARGMDNTGTQNFGGCVATAGGLVFIGATADELFRAFNAESGKELWSFKLPAGGYATPSIYEVNGKQFVVIAAGGGNRNNTPSNDVFIAFSLPN